jgi:hypothetical protein
MLKRRAAVDASALQAGPARKRLRNEALLAFVVKILFILFLFFTCFGPANRPVVSVETLFTPAGPAAPVNR